MQTQITAIQSHKDGQVEINAEYANCITKNLLLEKWR